MDRQIEFLPKLACNGYSQRCAGGNAKSQLRQRWDILYFTECLIENRHSWENGRVGTRKVGKYAPRHPVLAQHHRHATRNQRRDQVAEPIRVRNWNDAEVQIGVADSHRIANLSAIGEELLTPKSDRAGRSRCAGG